MHVLVGLSAGRCCWIRNWSFLQYRRTKTRLALPPAKQNRLFYVLFYTRIKFYWIQYEL